MTTVSASTTTLQTTTLQMWRVVVIDDSPDDRAEVRRLLLRGSERRYQFVEAETGAAGVRTALDADDPPDCVVLDYNLPDMDAVEVLAALAGADGLTACPVVVLTGTVGHEQTRAVLRAGAQDYLGKGWMTPESLTRAVENAIERWAMACELQNRDAALRETNQQLQLSLSVGRALTFIWDIPSNEIRRLQGIGSFLDATTGRPDTFEELCAKVHPDDRDNFERRVRQAIERPGREYANDYRVVGPDGSVRWINDTGRVEFSGDEKPLRLVGLATDITERKQAEQARHEMERNYRALAAASSEIAYRMSADWSTMLPLDGRQLVASSDQPLGDWAWLDQNLPCDEHPRVRQAISEAIARKTLFELEHRVRRPDGSIGWTLSRAVPILDENEEVIAWFGAASDITARKRAEQALADRTELLNGVLEGPTDVIFVKDLNGRVLLANAACAAVLTSTSEQVVGKTVEELLPPDLAAATRQHEEAVIAGGTPIQLEEWFLVAGEARVFLTLKAPLRDGGSRVVGLLGISRDITERKRAEEALRDNAVALADLDRRKNAFLATLSHELRDPLGVILSAVHLLRLTSQDRAAVEKGCARMERQVALLIRLIDDLMDVSRINEDKLTLRTERLNLATVAQSALETSRRVIDQRGHTVTVVLPPQPIEVDGDATRLAQVVSNLLTNAAKYSDPGSPIVLTVERQRDVAAVAVRDRGIGIAPADLRRVFELFAQVGGAAHLAQGGLGIGLHLVERVVELHGGSIEARSDGLGHGSEFLVRLPLASSEARTERPPDHDVLSPSPSRRYRILVADDNEDAVITLALLLRHLGHDVRTAENGAQAVAVATTFQPEVALLDIGMPELDGHEACRRIRAQPGGDTMVLVAVSGWGQDEDKRRARDAGFQHHLVKPVDPAALTELLHSLAPA